LTGVVRRSIYAQKQLYRQYSPLMMGLCMRYASGQDVLQDGFIKVFQKFDSLK
jgi:DNA-directed RNA polymerase specialized sigma24 family protein